MTTYTKPYGDFNNNVDVADATKVNAQINQLYTAINGGLDGVNVPGLGDMTTVTTTAKNAAGAINELQALPVFSMSRQALINGNFDVTQRGASFTNPASLSYTLDRWQTFNSADGGTLPTTIIHSQTATSPGELFGASNFYRINPNGAGSGFGVNASYSIWQKIENAVRYLCGSGKKVTLSFWARSSIAGKRLGIGMRQDYGTGGTPSSTEDLTGQIITLTSSWTKYAATFTTNTLSGKTFGTNKDDNLRPTFIIMWGTSTASQFLGGGTAETFGGSGNIDIAQVQVNAGDQALPFQPRSFAEELALCQRYYQRYDSEQNASIATFGLANATTGGNLVFNLQIKMRILPTLTYSALADMSASDGVSGFTLTSLSLTTVLSSAKVVALAFGVASGLTQFRSYFLQFNSSGKYLAFDAEL